jgi:hypothetical protein
MARSCGWNVTYLPRSAESILILEQIITQSQENVQPTYFNAVWNTVNTNWLNSSLVTWISTIWWGSIFTTGIPWSNGTHGNNVTPGTIPEMPAPVPGIPAWLALWSWLLALLTLRKKTKQTETLVRN